MAVAAHPHLVERAERNVRNTILCIAAVTAVLTATAWALGEIWDFGLPAAILGLGISVASSAGAYFSGDRVVLSLMGARPAPQLEYRELHNVVEEMAIASGLPKPEVYVIQSPASNALATGRDPQHAAVAVTTGLLEILNRNELQAVLGHEMSHIRHRDTLYAVVVAVLVGSIVIMTDLFWRSMRYARVPRGRKGSEAGALVLVIGLVLAILAPILARILQMAMSRQREYLADLGGADLTRNPEALADALEKIAKDPDRLDIANRGVQHLFILNPVNPFSSGEGTWNNLLNTHPPISDRIRVLRDLAHAPAFQGH